jgi:hypothetical protein
MAQLRATDGRISWGPEVTREEEGALRTEVKAGRT